MGKFKESLVRKESSLFFKGEGRYINRNPYGYESHLYSSNMIAAFIGMDEGDVLPGEFAEAFSGSISGLSETDEDIWHFLMNVVSLYYVLGQTKVSTKVDLFRFDNCLNSAIGFLKLSGCRLDEYVGGILFDYPEAELLKHVD